MIIRIFSNKNLTMKKLFLILPFFLFIISSPLLLAKHIVFSNPPIAICQDITVLLDTDGNASISPIDIDNGSTDDVAIVNMALNQMNFDCSMVGENIITLTVEDGEGNIATCTSLVTIEDNTPPIVACKDTTIDLNQAACNCVNCPSIIPDLQSTNIEYLSLIHI